MAKKKPAKKSNVKKAQVKPPSITDSINTEFIAAALSTANQLVLLKVCRLCEAKDGPFLNIFDADKLTAKKIEVVMPFRVTENDDLPHKICFRCSAKVEELYEFIQKCIKTQSNLRKVISNKGSSAKINHRELWEEKLNQSNISNDAICDALIKKAMEGIKDIPLNPLPTAMSVLENKTIAVKKTTKKAPIVIKKEESEQTNQDQNVHDNKDDEPISALKSEKLLEEEQTPVKRSTRLSIEKKIEGSDNKSTKPVENKEIAKPNKKIKSDTKVVEELVPKEKGLKIKQSLQTNNFSSDAETSKIETIQPEVENKPFDIMEHVSMIKVNGVGVLFQCKMCNRNFLKKDVVMSHACAKQGIVKIQGPKNISPPEPPKVPQTVKYITMKVDKDLNNSLGSDDKLKSIENKKPTALSEPINLDDEDDKPLAPKKPKPKIGPASKVKRNVESNPTLVGNEPSSLCTSNQLVVPTKQGNAVLKVSSNVTSNVQVPSVQFPTIPSLNSRYKLMPGPNNTFTLVEEKNDDTGAKVNTSTLSTPVNQLDTSKAGTKIIVGPKNLNSGPKSLEKPTASKGASVDRPYPVGLIKSISAANPTTQANTDPVSFPTAAMKKQSYTVVQTGNPSKLLISSKPQLPPPEEEVPKKRQRKTRNLVKEDEAKKQPFSVTIEDAAPPADPGFFTFINVDPLLQPSYVLPTDNIIQESQISTSTNISKQNDDKDNKYTCNMCNEKFSREKKLLAHIHSHYTKLDEEDQLRAEKNPKKRNRK